MASRRIDPRVLSSALAMERTASRSSSKILNVYGWDSRSACRSIVFGIPKHYAHKTRLSTVLLKTIFGGLVGDGAVGSSGRPQAQEECGSYLGLTVLGESLQPGMCPSQCLHSPHATHTLSWHVGQIPDLLDRDAIAYGAERSSAAAMMMSWRRTRIAFTSPRCPWSSPSRRIRAWRTVPP